MLNKAYVRGVNDALREHGVVKFANDDMANEAADALAEASLPEDLGEVPPETTAALAANLSELADALQQSADSAGQAAAVADSAKTSSVRTAAAWLRHKLSGDTGSTITGTKPEQQNTMNTSESAEAAMDQANRPGGKAYANVGVRGVGTQEASGEGTIGTEKKRDEKMGPVAEGGSNSAIDAVKSASIIQLLRKLAEGSTITGTDPGQQNSLAQAAQVTGEGQLEAGKRPHDYANMGVTGVGQSDMADEMRAAAIGIEQPHPGQEGHSGAPANTVIDQSKTSADKLYLNAFKAVASKYAQYLPPRLSAGEKVAAIKYLLSQEPVARDRLAMTMSKTAELPAGLAEYVAKEKDEEKDEKKDEKKDEDEKTSAVLRNLRNLLR